MALLFVQAVGSRGAASEGNKGAAFLAVSVCRADGTPNRELAEEHFRVVVVVSPGGTQPAVTYRLNDVSAEDGFYLLSVFPKEGTAHDRWSAGDYVFGIAISTEDSGQTLAAVAVPR
jgi:hypothetical protein